ncbi:hypothetical protein SAMN05444746_1486 [Variovorax sp. OK212]|nr:hypothetical protein SAMN05518853_1506 [Variovorax sp. OK202]SFE82720.1 hypothetical protein SAMN05444746_1486 [Variovorax sp. OK212]
MLRGRSWHARNGLHPLRIFGKGLDGRGRGDSQRHRKLDDRRRRQDIPLRSVVELVEDKRIDRLQEVSAQHATLPSPGGGTQRINRDLPPAPGVFSTTSVSWRRCNRDQLVQIALALTPDLVAALRVLRTYRPPDASVLEPAFARCRELSWFLAERKRDHIQNLGWHRLGLRITAELELHFALRMAQRHPELEQIIDLRLQDILDLEFAGLAVHARAISVFPKVVHQLRKSLLSLPPPSRTPAPRGPWCSSPPVWPTGHTFHEIGGRHPTCSWGTPDDITVWAEMPAFRGVYCSAIPEQFGILIAFCVCYGIAKLIDDFR